MDVRPSQCVVKHAELKIIGCQFVKGFAPTPVSLRGGCMDQVSVQIEGAEKTFFIKSHAWLNPFQRILIHEK